ncbi:MAG TPA: T9SS type A sorting domain-containing protein [Ignavibacteria bacterium]|jgi:hypothetical protein
MIKKIIFLIFISIFLLISKADEIYLPPGTCLTVPAGSNFCADTLTVDTNACFIASDSSVICQGMVIRGGGQIIIAVENISTEIPREFRLFQNFPNPFNPTTKIKFDIPPLSFNKGLQPLVQIKVYDILGSEAATLVNEQLKPGTYEIEWDASNYPSGVYYYKLVADDFTETKRMVLIK